MPRRRQPRRRKNSSVSRKRKLDSDSLKPNGKKKKKPIRKNRSRLITQSKRPKRRSLIRRKLPTKTRRSAWRRNAGPMRLRTKLKRSKKYSPKKKKKKKKPPKKKKKKKKKKS